ncbi:carbamoyltransferase C-terminal domain-containing protein [Micromonospora sp. WMMD1082]|uniref:carbamoyltransferase family protein n=1 Tax=Micromonospora sp. WMMD1082 TaxID=3016104 RepID=UPI002416B6B9|nr:carbamoyltransferase C-terminal domain-containing protein [Micromonospora sp. WMMD1082]MDG4792749.1 carbamoyltransferase C-terminal domain-containing protein [Micromonospora sp. WMMD1082]
MSYVLGLNLSHDRSAALVEDGKVLVAIEEERLDRIKHSEGFLVQGYFERLTKTLPMKAVAYCLDHAGIGIDEVDLVVGNRPLGDGAVWRILRELPIKDKSRVHAIPLPSHHLAHAATTFYTSPFEEAAILVVDQAGSRSREGLIEKHTAFVGAGTEIRPVASTTYPVDYSDLSLGCFYDFFTTKLNFITRYGTPDWGLFECGGYPEAGKTMGLAPYGRPRPEWGDWLTFDGFDITVSQESLEQIWKEISSAAGEGYEPKAPGSWQHQFAKDVAFKVQDELERAMLHLARTTYELTGKRQLCLAGGIMLNSVANQRIRSEGPFEEIFIPAPAGDSGNAIGTALYGWHQLLGGAQRHTLRTAALGRRYSPERVDRALECYRGRLEWRETTVEEVAGLLAEHHFVGWYQGSSEMGPRALGHRSILADPRHPRTRDYLNTTIKHREVFRPYAPSVLAEQVSEWFDFVGESPFMLLVPDVLAERRDEVPAITHVDGTARVQTVHADLDPEYHALISAFAARTGVPLLLNTSYNDNGEPIVETPEDALRTFHRTELDFLYLEGRLVSKPGRTLPDGHPRETPLP